jgi:hypothetical protein
MYFFDWPRAGGPRAVFGLVVLGLGGLGFACGPALAPPTPTATQGDPFAVVRATSQAAYESGKAHFERGELQAALIDLDRAKTNDPDSRADIQQALQQTISLLESMTPPAAPADSGPRIVVATLPPQTPAPPRAAPPTQTPPPAQTSRPAQATLPPASKPTTSAPQGTGVVSTPGPPGAAATAGAATSKPTTPSQGTASSGASLTPWRDPQGRFSLATPPDWSKVELPQALFGAGIVQFVDPSGRAEFDVAVDSSSKVVSPELYAASMELAMQQQMPGYASEQMVPGSTSGNPSVRRVFTFMRRDSAGRDQAVRGFQSTVLKGSTPYIISGSAPADQFQQYSPIFDQMVESFRFS